MTIIYCVSLFWTKRFSCYASNIKTERIERRTKRDEQFIVLWAAKLKRIVVVVNEVSAVLEVVKLPSGKEKKKKSPTRP